MTNKEKIIITLRRFLKVFLSTFLTTGFAFMEMFGGGAVILSAFQTSFKDGLNALVTIFLIPLLTSSIAAGLNACAKLFRLEDYKNKIIKFISDLF